MDSPTFTRDAIRDDEKLPTHDSYRTHRSAGAGQMGTGIAHVFAQSGFPVRMIDVSSDAVAKGRATIAGTNGEYHFNCPLDQRLLTFAGVDANALKKELGKGKGDWEILEWFQKNSEHQRTDAETNIKVSSCNPWQERKK